MENSKPKQKRTLRFVIIGIILVPVLFILYIVASILLGPVFDNFDKARFEKLDKQSRTLYEEIVVRSGGVEKWNYEASCDPNLAGDWPTGEYTCETLISAEVQVSTVDELNALHEKYYPVIDGSRVLKQDTELDKQYPGQFGVKFVVSSAEKDYLINEIGCTYRIKLSQTDSNYNFKYGADIVGSKGRATIGVDCAGSARGDWYDTNSL